MPQVNEISWSSMSMYVTMLFVMNLLLLNFMLNKEMSKKYFLNLFIFSILH